MTIYGPSPLYALLNEINIAAENNLSLLAITMTVTLPDICVSLSSADGRTNGEKYQAWCDQNIPRSKFSFVTSKDLYSMRCGVVHNGRFGDLSHTISRVIFMPLESGATMINCQINDAYIYSVVDFCRNFTEAVHVWFEKNRTDENVVRNLPNLMQYRFGMHPYIEGTTILA